MVNALANDWTLLISSKFDIDIESGEDKKDKQLPKF